MSRLFEMLVGGLVDLASFFDNIRAHRSDDEITAEYRARQRACVRSSALAAIGLITILFVTHVFDSVSLLQQPVAAIDEFRRNVGIAMMVGMFSLLSYSTYTYWALWRFLKNQRD